MADAGACRRAEKKDPGSHTGKDLLTGMMTGFVQNIEISCPFSGVAFPFLYREESCTETSCAAFRNSFALFSN